ncbi:hypothetical protein [Bifidobacterium callitrichidarum]|uniref:Uridine kinase n=1 Tax=Bifidobacterium callitrichidarum TaxID=2052941 RepID=A0A2U2NCS6_9BIFI|nr:hypothetical protein [Bifidobacterium callitrichidarum]PWG66922.1 hypothetical protein DF196_01515 [Bifidobacterium callitrichidarum]
MGTHHDIEVRNKHDRLAQAVAVAATSVLCLTALAACSSPFTVGGGTDTAEADDTGTSSTAATGSGKGGPVEPSKTVKRFVACLAGKGFDARSVDWDNDQVGVVELDAAGNPAQSQVTIHDDGTKEYSHATPEGLYPNVVLSGSVGNSITDENWNYVIFRTSADMAGTPYASRQADYAACEAQNPDFAQATFSTEPRDANASDEDKAAVLKYAQDARAKGFDWIADPSGEHPLTIVIPNTVPEEDVRHFFQECPVDDVPVIIGWEGDYPYDTFAVQQPAH